jgi:ProP effector
MYATTVLNTKEKHLSKMKRQEALDWLANKFPHAFNNQTRIRPFKVGIMKDIMDYAEEALEAGISKSKLREAVVLFTRRIDYLTCLKSKEQRINLFGESEDFVTDEEAVRAANKIKMRVEKATKHAHQTSKKPVSFHSRDSATSKTTQFTSCHTQQRPIPSIIVRRKFHRPDESTAISRLKEKLDLSELSE